MKKEKTKMCDRCGCFMDYSEDFCPDCGIENFNAPDIGTLGTSTKSKDSFGAWILIHGRAKNGKETNPPLYTKIVTDDIRHKATGKRFCRGRYVLFWASRGETPPQLIEDTNDFRIVYHKSIFESIVIKK